MPQNRKQKITMRHKKRHSPFFQYCRLWNKCPVVDRILDSNQWWHPGNVGYPQVLFVLSTLKKYQTIFWDGIFCLGKSFMKLPELFQFSIEDGSVCSVIYCLDSMCYIWLNHFIKIIYEKGLKVFIIKISNIGYNEQNRRRG